jgi:sn-glycerol 3-phosphate transport system substrate-binding protein
MTGRSWRACAAALLVVGLVAAGCSGGDDDSGGSNGGGGSGGDLPDCPLAALDKATQPVQITFWHAMTRANETALEQLTDSYNASQKKVHVKLVNNSSYDDQQDKYRAGLRTGDLPDVVQHQDIYLQQLVDTKTILPAQSCIEAASSGKAPFEKDDFVPRALSYYTVDGALQGLPFNMSNPVLSYDKAAFRKAGLDPDKPPTTLDEIRTDAQKIKQSGADRTGMAIKMDSWQFEQLLAQQGKTFVDNGNGRDKRATAAAFDDDAGRAVFQWMSGMVADGLATSNPATGPSEFDNLIGIGNHAHAMTMDTSAALGTILQVLQGGQYQDIDLGVAAMPNRTGDGGITVGGAALYISATDPAKQAAAWDYMTWMTSPESQSKWAAATGYVPVRKSSVDLPEVKKRWAEVPGFKVAYDQLLDGKEDTATAGAVIGDFEAVRDAVQDAESSMFVDKAKPDAALKGAAGKATKAMQSYNDRL